MRLPPLGMLLAMPLLLCCAIAGAADPTAPPATAPAAAPDLVVLDRKLAENSNRIAQVSRGLPKIGSLVLAGRKGGVLGDVVQLPLVQLGAVNTGDTLDKYVIASSRKGYLFSWPDGAKLYFGGGHYFADTGCSGQVYVRYDFLPLAAQYLGAVIVDAGKVMMVPPRGVREIVVRSFRDGEHCVDAQETGTAFGILQPNVPNVSGIPNVASFADDIRLGVN